MPALPDTFSAPNINPIPKRKPARGFDHPSNRPKGRIKGSVNKVTRDIKNGILIAAENLGRDGRGAGGFIGFLEYLGWHHPKAFAHLLGKMLPLQVNAETSGKVDVTFAIQSIPSGSYLAVESIERLRAPALFEGDVRPMQLDATLSEPIAPVQEIAAQTPSEEDQIAGLKREINTLAQKAGLSIVV